ncbi:MAG: zinc metallopeptidase [Bacilli bacterium]
MDLMLLRQETPITILLFIIGLLIVIGAQIKITKTYKNLKKITLKKELTGFEVARKILDNNGLQSIYIVETRGQLTDHYNPQRKVIKLSSEVFHGTTIASAAIAAHEVGHAIQDKENYIFMKIRSFLAPIVNIVTYLGYFVAFISLIASITGYIKVGIFLIIIALLFQLVTLPVEFDASKRAKEEIKKLKLTSGSENNLIKEMLTAAALTYVAGFISSIMNLLRLILMLKDE